MNYSLIGTVTAVTFAQVALFLVVRRAAVRRSISLGYLWPALTLFNIELSSFAFLTGLIRAFKDVGQVSAGAKVAFLQQGQRGSVAAAMIALVGFMAMVAVAFAYSQRSRNERYTVSRKRLILTYAPVVLLFAAFVAAAGVLSYWSIQWASLPDTFAWPAGEMERMERIVTKFVPWMYMSQGLALVSSCATSVIVAISVYLSFKEAQRGRGERDEG